VKENASFGLRGRGFLSSRREEIIENQYNEIKELESRYRTLYEKSPVMKRTINRDGIILDCNEAYLKGLGYSSMHEVKGHPYSNIPQTKESN